MKTISNVLGIFVISTLASSQIAWSSTPSAKQWLVDMDQGSGNVEFRATGHPSSLKIVGNGAAPKGKIGISGNQVTGSITFDLDTLDTGIDLRTHHMKEKYLETAKYRNAKLTLQEMKLPQDVTSDHFMADNVPFKGVLLLHGVEKPVTGTAMIEKNGDKVNFAANFGLKVSDFGISIPVFAGITMADDVQVKVADSAPLVASSQAAKPKSRL